MKQDHPASCRGLHDKVFPRRQALMMGYFLNLSISSILVAKIDSSQHTVPTNFIMFSYLTAVNIYKKI